MRNVNWEIITVLLLVIGISTLCQATIGDVYVSMTPIIPTVDANNKVTWGSNWIQTSLPCEIKITKNCEVYLALENLYRKNQTKQVVMKFDGIPNGIKMENPAGLAGYPPHADLDPKTKPWNVGQIIGFDPISLTLIGTINPQPSWEWIKIGCASTAPPTVKLNIEKYYSTCVPEPATVCLLGLGALLLRRRKSA
jgi:hypothetical protein